MEALIRRCDQTSNHFGGASSGEHAPQITNGIETMIKLTGIAFCIGISGVAIYTYFPVGATYSTNTADQFHTTIEQYPAKQTESCVPFTKDDFIKPYIGMPFQQVLLINPRIPQLKSGFKWCKDANGHSYQAQEAYITKTTPTYAAPVAGIITDKIVVGSEVYVIGANGKFVQIGYFYGGESYSGWVDYRNISINR